MMTVISSVFVTGYKHGNKQNFRSKKRIGATASAIVLLS